MDTYYIVLKDSDKLSKTLSKDEVIDIIVKTTGLDRSEIVQKINETITMMDQMVNEEGAAYIVADQLNVSLEADKTSTTLKIDQLLAGQSNVTVIGRISKIYPTNTFTRKDNTIGKVRNIELLDNTGSIRVSLWDGKVDSFIQKNISIGDILGISGGNVKTGYKDALEISVGAHGLLDNSVPGIKDSDFPDIPKAEKISLNSLIDANGEVSIEGKIIEKQPIYEFDREGRKGKVASLTVKDETGQTRVTFWNDDCDKHLNYEIGDEISVSSLRITTNKYGDKELTFNSYSIIDKITDTGKFDTVIVSDPDKCLNIADITDGMNNITVVGKVIELYDLKEFEKEGRTNQVQSLLIQDNTGSIRVTFWGNKTNDISKMTSDNTVKISFCRSRFNDYSKEVEITATDKSVVELNPEEGKAIEEISSAKLTFSDISSVRKRVSIILKISRVFEERTVNIRDTDAKVLNLSVVDTEGNQGKIAAWDDNINKISDLAEEDSIELTNVKIKPGSGEYGPEVTISNNTTVSRAENIEFMPVIQTADKLQKGYYHKTPLNQLSPGSSVHVVGTIVKVYKPTIYDGCSSCQRKVMVDVADESIGKCIDHGEVKPEPKLILALVLDDNIDTCTLKFFGNRAEELLGEKAKDAKEKIERLSDPLAPVAHLEMKAIWIEGRVVKDEVRDEISITVDKFGYPDIDQETDSILSRYEDY